jgi:predicted amidohydrolase
MRIAVFQMTSGIDPARNAVALAEAVRLASEGGAAILFTPEMTGLLDRNRARGAAHLTDQDRDPVLAQACELARAHGTWIALGSLALAGMRGDGRLVNRSILIDPAGAVQAHYDKIHLFDVDLPTGESWRESAAYAPGEGAVVADGPAGQRLGLSICYDVRFPALYQRLSEAGATILSVPAAFTVPTGQAHWHILLRARAIENACFVVAAAQSGTHEDGRATFGHSLVIGPWGDVLLDMGEGSGVGFADLDLDEVTKARARVPVIAHRRTVAPVARSA